MNKIININERGTLTLPKEAREKLGLLSAGQVVLQETPEGLLLRPGMMVPIEIYSDERIAEFEKNNEADLKKFKF